MTMLRMISAAFVLALATAAHAQVTGALTRATPVLKSEVTITGELVRIGDLVENAGAAENVAIFRAPDPGSTGVVAAERILTALRAHAVIGVDTRGTLEVVVTRASRTITAQQFQSRVAQALAGKYRLGGAANIDVTFDREIRTLHVERDAAAELQIAHLRYDPRTTRFDAILELPASGTAKPPLLRLSGTAVETVEIATLMRAYDRGEVLKASDVVIERRPKSEATGPIIAASDRAVGLAARRPLRAGVALRDGDLMRPELVQRNESVTIVYEAPGIMLTMRGKALESGSDGDSIAVLNVQSKRTVHGTVSGPGRVDVVTASQQLGGSAVAAPATDKFSGQRRGVE
jgi:flagella basal body P-ring formation protein FlgA